MSTEVALTTPQRTALVDVMRAVNEVTAHGAKKETVLALAAALTGTTEDAPHAISLGITIKEEMRAYHQRVLTPTMGRKRTRMQFVSSLLSRAQTSGPTPNFADFVWERGEQVYTQFLDAMKTAAPVLPVGVFGKPGNPNLALE